MPNSPEAVVAPGTPTQRQELLARFSSHELGLEEQAKVDAMRAKIRTVALHINKHLPQSREKSLALTNLEQTLFWANAALARHQE